MANSRKLFISTILGVSCLATGCVNNTTPASDIKEEEKKDVNYDYAYPYYISNSKVLETENDDVIRGKKHLYVRAWDNKNSTKKDGYYGLQRAGEYTYNNFIEAFNPDTKMFSYESISDSTADLCKKGWKAEFDEFFKNNEDNDINYVVLSCNGDINGNLFILDDYNENGSYKHKILFSEVINWFDNYKGKFFIVLSAAYGGSWLRSDYVVSYGFLNKLNKDKYTIISGPTDNALSFRAYSYVSTSDDTISLPSDLASQISCGLLKDENNNYVADYDGDGNLSVDELYTYGRVSYGTKGTFCEIFAQNREQDFILSDHRLDLYSLTSGSFIEDGKERLSINIPKDQIIKSIGMPNIKENYKFTGWSFDREGTNKVTFPLKLTENTRLFANYECKNAANPGYISAQQHDKIRIPYKDGSYNDFYILDFKTNEGQQGMFLVSTDIAGMTKYPADGVTGNYYWTGTAAEAWTTEYLRRFFSDELNSLIIPCNAALAPASTNHLSDAKMFFLSQAEAEEFLTQDMLALDVDYFLRNDSKSNNLQVKTTGIFKTISKTLSDVKGTRPAINLNIAKDDLAYDNETNTFYIKSVGKYVKTTPKRYDGTYTVKVDGEITYTADGNRKLACDYMNTLASSRWETNKPWVYKDGYDTFLFKPGKYRGTLYNTNLRDFYDYEHIEDCFVGTQVHGLDCAAAVSAAYTLAFGKKFISNFDVAPEKEYLYGCMQYASDAIEPGIGKLCDYLQKNKDKTPANVNHHDIVHIPGNPELPTVANNETAIFGHLLDESLQAVGKNIYEDVYQYIRPGDGIVARGVGADKSSTSHTRMVIGVDIVHDDGGKIDAKKSKIYYADTSTPKSGRFIYGGESTSYCNFETYSSKKTNSVTFEELLSIGYLPFTMNDWEKGYDSNQIGHWVD